MLEPIEMFRESVGVRVIEPMQQVPLRHYSTIPGAEFELAGADQRFKPGFLSQANELAAVVRHDTPVEQLRSAGLADAVSTLKLAHRMSNAD